MIVPYHIQVLINKQAGEHQYLQNKLSLTALQEQVLASNGW